MLFLPEGQLQNLLTFSGQIDVKHYVREKLTFLMGWCCVVFKLSDIEIKHKQKSFQRHIQYSSLRHFLISHLL